jgi:succinate dehydrogenase/fumarate reductase flavoprotein subunit
MKKDVIVIGTGLAGMVAAYAAQAEGADVLLIDKGPVGTGTNSAYANAVFAGPTSSYPLEDYINDTIRIGKKINHARFVRKTAQGVPRALELLDRLGIELQEHRDAYVFQPSRTDIIRGMPLVRNLAKTIKDLKRVVVLPGFYVSEILQGDGKACGVNGFGKDGQERSFSASTVVLATGGCGAIYLRNDNHEGILGQGYFLAAKAGLDLWDMEFVQFYPIVMVEPGLPSVMLYPPYPKEARLLNASGEDIPSKHALGDINEAIRKKRDTFSAMIFSEGKEGPVHMDYRETPSALWDTYPLTLLKNMRFDFRARPVRISPGAHFFMGGVRTDDEGQTALDGLFACGEAVWGLHGANRRGGNALTECIVWGMFAGQNAARHALETQAPHPKPEESDDSDFPKASGRMRYRELRRRIKEIAWEYAGVVRSEEGLRKGLQEMDEVDRMLRQATPMTASELKLRQDMMSASFVLRAILLASLARQESRGAFMREDFPQEDNVNWQKNSCLRYEPKAGVFSISHQETKV